MRKYILVLAANILLILFISGQTLRSDTDTAVSGSPRFTYVCPDVWEECAGGMRRADDALGTDTRYIGFRTADVDRQASAIHSAVYSKVKGIITGGRNRSSGLTESIREAVSRGIPVVMAGMDLENTDRTCYIGPDNYEMGKQAGRDLTEAVRAGTKAAVIIPDTGNVNLKERAEGFRAAIADDPDIEIVEELECGFDQITIQELMLDLLGKHPEINALFCADLAVSEIAGEVLGNVERETHCTVVCCGLSDAVWNYISDRTYFSTVAADSAQIGYEAVAFLWDYLNGKRQNTDVIFTDTIDVRADFEYAAWNREQNDRQVEWSIQ